MGIDRFSSLSSRILENNLHPYRIHLVSKGLSHGLKSVHRTLFTLPPVGPSFRVPTTIKKANTQMGIGFFGGSPGTRTLDPRLKRALLYQLS